MNQTASNSARAASLARRQAMSNKGKAAIGATNTRQAPTRPVKATPASVGASSVSAPAPAVRASTPRKGIGVSSAKAASLARRLAMSSRGKAAVKSADRTRSMSEVKSASAAVGAPSVKTESKGCGCGCNGEKATCRAQAAASPAAPAPRATKTVNKKMSANISTTRAASLARRHAMSSRGKAGVSAGGMTAAQTARAVNPTLSGRELAKALREQRSKNGNIGKKASQPCGRRRPEKAAAIESLKVGVSETTQGQSVTGTMVGRSVKTTGDEPSTCRSITGTEYMGADVFRQFCSADPKTSVRKVGVSNTNTGNAITGTEVGRSERVTGDEPGTCHRITGVEYVGAEKNQAFCGSSAEPAPAKVSRAETTKGRSVTGSNVGRSSKVTGDEVGASRTLTGSQYMQPGDGAAPAKVGVSQTTRGGSISGTLTGRSEKVTGDEPGSCKYVTGDDYVSAEQYQTFCKSSPEPRDRKVGVSATQHGLNVSGTMTDRAEKVTGNEPGTCHAITGTPYAGAEQYKDYCSSEQIGQMEQRTRANYPRPGSVMTGQQPASQGLTGAQKGACETVSGTPYQSTEQCDTTHNYPAAESPFDSFTVGGPSHAAANQWSGSGVTGTRYEQGKITGPFGMAGGKVTGTEEFRFDRKAPVAPMPEAAEGAGENLNRETSRITGEGQDKGLRITGDDWDRGDRVTGTEGMSATRRNPTLRSGMSSVMPAAQEPKRNEEVAPPVSKVTGSSGNTERGSLITYSGGARG